MTAREKRVLKAFLNCIDRGEYTEDYAITLIEDQARYGWLSDDAKDWFYEELEKRHPEPEPEPEEEIPNEVTIEAEEESGDEE